MKHTGRSAVALLLLVSGYVAALLLALVAVVGLLRLVLSGATTATVASVVVPFVGLVVLTLLAGRARAAREAELPEGIALAQTAQPRLWADVQSVADRVDSRAPDEIWVTDRVCAELVEDSTFLGLRPGRRTLVLGIPLMLGLSAEQLRWAVAHELAHDSQRQPGLRTMAHRGVASVRRLRGHLGDGLLDRLLATVGRAVEELALPALHAQELAADRIATDLVGSRTAVAALKELGPLDEAWLEFGEQYVLPGVLVGQRPTGLFGGFVDFLDDDDRQTWMAAYDERHPTGPTAPAGHPRLDLRVTALKELQNSRRLDFSGAAEDILDRRDVVFEALEGAVTADSPLEPGVFERVVPRGTAVRVGQQVEALGAVARQLDLWPLEESVLLQVVRAGRESPLMRALAPDADGDELDVLAGRLVADLAAHRLVEAGRASYAMSWSAAPALRDRAGRTLDPWSVAARATGSAEGVAELKEWLAEQQVRLSRQAAPAPTPATPVVAKPEPTPMRQPQSSPAPEAAPSGPLTEPAEADEADEAAVSTPVEPVAAAAADPAPRRATPRDLMAPLLRRISGQPTPDEPAPGQAALEPDSQSLAAVEAIVRDRWEDSRAPVVSELPHVERPTAGRSTAAPETEATHEGTAGDTDEEAATEEAAAAVADDAPVRTQREALKARLKEIDRLHRAKEAERAAAAAGEGSPAGALAHTEPNAEPNAEPDAEPSLAQEPEADEVREPLERQSPPEADHDDGSDHADDDDHDEMEPPAPPPVINPDLVAAIVALGGAAPAAPASPEPADEPDTAPGAAPKDRPDAGGRGAPTPEPAAVPAAGPAAGTPAPDQPLPAAAFAAGPVAEDLTGVLAAAAPIAGSARGTLVVSPVGISLRRPSVSEMVRLAKQGAARGAELLSRASGLSLHDLTSHRRTDTLSWSDITWAEFSGLSEDQGVLTVYVGTRPAQRVEFLSNTEIQGDLLGVLERLLGPRLRVS